MIAVPTPWAASSATTAYSGSAMTMALIARSAISSGRTGERSAMT